MCSALIMTKVGYEGTDGGTHSSTLDMFIKLTLEDDVCVFKAELQKGNYALNGHAVLCGRVGSCGNFCCTMMIERSNVTEVKKALTSKDVITSAGPAFCCGFVGQSVVCF